jgi:carboxyl-terminal processing protease
MKKFLALVLCFIMVFSSVSALADEKATFENEIVKIVRNYIDRYYTFEVDDKKMLEQVIGKVLENNPELYDDVLRAMLSSLDEHSQYYTKEEFDEFYSVIETEIAGIGAYLESHGKYIRVSSVIAGSPAEQSGLMSNDIILSVDGESLENYGSEYAATVIRGKVGTDVTLEIERNGVKMTFVVTRANVKTTSVYSGMLTETIGYIQIMSFNSGTAKDFKNALGELIADGARKFLIDLRNNGGGVTDQALECVSYFLPKNTPLLAIISKAEGTQIVENVVEGFDNPLVVLVNEYTASAAEIFVSALKYNNRAEVVGKTTFGKGTMQNTASLGAYGGIKLTVAEFCGPNGEPINGCGIIPNHMVENVKTLVPEGYFEKLTYEKKYKLGDKGPEIATLKKMLAVLGYMSYSNTDEMFDRSLYNAVKNFQKEMGLFSYGELDFTTQISINNMSRDAFVLNDTQYEKALRLLEEK